MTPETPVATIPRDDAAFSVYSLLTRTSFQNRRKKVFNSGLGILE